jgi:putative flippase GtrA
VIRRWLTFNGVGALGLAVQLGTLSLLIDAFGWHFLPATALAVEAAVVHNFLWHQRWTWRDRPADGGTILGRLWRFQALNGVVSLAGNLAIMAVLVGGLGLHPAGANLAAVLACSLVNFFGSEVLVFRTAPVVGILLLAPAMSNSLEADEAAAARLQPQTLAAWRQYEQVVDARHAALSAQAEPFFAHDAYGREAGWMQRVMKGALDMFQPDAPAPGRPAIDVPDGRIHHWVGAVFVPNVTLAAVLARLHELAGRESESYKEVIASRLMDRAGDHFRVFMKIQRDASVVTVTYNTEHDVEYRRLGRSRASNRSIATKIAELTGAGTPQEREKRPGDDSGYLWRLNAYWRYEEVPGGVLIECESVSLSRSVPFVFRPLVNPIANRLARESLEGTLTTLRTVVAPHTRALARR